MKNPIEELTKKAKDVILMMDNPENLSDEYKSKVQVEYIEQASPRIVLSLIEVQETMMRVIKENSDIMPGRFLTALMTELEKLESEA